MLVILLTFHVYAMCIDQRLHWYKGYTVEHMREHTG